MTFYRESGELFKIPIVNTQRLLIQATLGPVFMGLYFLWPVTLPVIFVLIMMLYVGSRLNEFGFRR